MQNIFLHLTQHNRKKQTQNTLDLRKRKHTKDVKKNIILIYNFF